MTFFSTGDLGDIIASLPSIKKIGGGDYAIGFREAGQRETMQGSRFEAIKPLLESQPYINKTFWSDDLNGVTHDFSTFRIDYQRHGNLATQQARHLGIQISLDPWLEIEADKHGRVVIARSLRYRNPLFPWRKILNKYPKPIFVGLPEEHMEFQMMMSQRIEYVSTSDLLQLAKIIAGARMLISNQTLAFWIGAGVGVPIIQESWSFDLNSVIERENIQYTRTEEETKTLANSLSCA